MKKTAAMDMLTRLAVFALAVVLSLPQAAAAPDKPAVSLTHTGDGDRVVYECTGQVAAPDGESEYQVDMTLSVQAGAGVTLDPSSVQVLYQTEDGETAQLDRENWDLDTGTGLLVTALTVDTDMAGQILCRVSGQIAAGTQGTITSAARLDVAYRDLLDGSSDSMTATATDALTRTQTWSLTLDLNGGTLAGKTGAYLWREDLKTGQQVNLADLPKPERTGFFFDGWTLAAGTGARLESGSLLLGSGNATLQAVWTSKEDKLTLDLNGGSGRTVTIDGLTGEDVVVPAPSEVLYSRDGYKLAGWTDTPDGALLYTGGESYTLTREEDVLYAWWAPQYTLSYDANGGTGQMPRRVFSASEPAIVSDNAFTRSGYAFTGWCMSADGRGTLYQSGDTLTLSENTTLYAQWEPVYAEPPAEKDNHLPLLLGILAALVVVGAVCGLLAWRRRRDDGPYDDGYDGDDYNGNAYDGDGYDEEDTRYDDRFDYRDRDRYDRGSRYGDRSDRRRSGPYDDRYHD